MKRKRVHSFRLGAPAAMKKDSFPFNLTRMNTTAIRILVIETRVAATEPAVHLPTFAAANSLFVASPFYTDAKPMRARIPVTALLLAVPAVLCAQTPAKTATKMTLTKVTAAEVQKSARVWR